MATIKTSQFGSSTCPQVQLTATLSSTTTDKTTLSWSLKYIPYGYAFSISGGARAYSVEIDGTTVKTGTYDINGKSSSSGYTIASGTKEITKGKSSKSISLKISFTFNASWGGTYAGTKTASGTIDVPAKPSYKITYNANGGSGAPSSQTKWYGTNVTLSTSKPTRTGHSFSKWNTTSAGNGTSYNSGATYTTNAALSLYAIWNKNTYTVSYNANGGSGVPSAQTKIYGTNLTLSSTIPTRTGYKFKGWATSSSGSVAYAAGATYKSNASVMLYAVWEVTYTKPVISNLKVTRCESDGTTLETGTYAKVTFSWSTCKATGNAAHFKQVDITCNGTTYTDTSTTTTNGQTGTHTKIIGNNALDIDTSYSISVKLTDDKGGSTTKTCTLGGTRFPIDFKSGGSGVAIGKPASEADLFDVNYKTMFRDDITIINNKKIFGIKPDGSVVDSFNAQNQNGNTIIGYGNYSGNSGYTNIYGQRVCTYSKDGTFINNCKIAENQVLWSGTCYMTSTQTATLSSAISSQANGVILVWSYYTDGAAENSSFNLTFIPKYFVSAHSGKGVVSIVSTATMNAMASKYVYVSDTSITGHSNNNAEDITKNTGILSSPRNFVLRYVIGV